MRPLLLASIATHSVCACPLEPYRGVNRLIVVSLPQQSSVKNVTAVLARNRDKITERDLKIIDLSDGAQRVTAALRLPPEQIKGLRKQLRIFAADDRPVFILVGKDGGEKARQYGTLDLEKWVTLIDAMPMRQQEIRKQQKGSN